MSSHAIRSRSHFPTAGARIFCDAGVAWSKESQVVTDIRAARKAGAHIVIPFMHWGWGNEVHPDRLNDCAGIRLSWG